MGRGQEKRRGLEQPKRHTLFPDRHVCLQAGVASGTNTSPEKREIRAGNRCLIADNWCKAQPVYKTWLSIASAKKSSFTFDASADTIRRDGAPQLMADPKWRLSGSNVVTWREGALVFLTEKFRCKLGQADAWVRCAGWPLQSDATAWHRVILINIIFNAKYMIQFKYMMGMQWGIAFHGCPVEQGQDGHSSINGSSWVYTDSC